jgi:DNA-binding transcriptional regulator YiaG
MKVDEFKAIRQRAGLTQNALAAFLRLGDNGGRYVRMIEAGDRTPSGPICYLMELLDQGVIKPE